MKKNILVVICLVLVLCGCDNSSSSKKEDPLTAALNSSNHEVTGKLNQHPINDPFDQPRK